MHIVLFRYSAKVVMLNHLTSINTVVFAPKSQEVKYKKFEEEGHFLPKVIYIEDYTLPSIVLEIRKIEETEIIESITSLAEDDMDWVGLLHDHFVCGNSRFASNVLFKDKYFMRSLLLGKVSQPYFRLLESSSDLEKFWETTSADKAIIKPRTGAGSEEVIKIKRADDISDKYCSGKYLIEEFITLNKMMTCDGYSVGNNICRFFSHEYEELLFDSLSNTRELITRTNRMYSTHLSMLKLAFNECIKVLSEFCVKGELTPFHFEWFYDEDTEEIYFCEVGKRFGGAEIPKLINYSFGIDVLEEYWDALVKNDKKIHTLRADEIILPQRISTTYSPYRQEGKLRSVPTEKEFHWTESTYIFVKEGDELERASSIVENTFTSQFVSKDEAEYDENISKIRKLAQDFKYDH